MILLADRNAPHTKQVVEVLGFDVTFLTTSVVMKNTVSGDTWIDTLTPNDLCIFNTKLDSVEVSEQAVRDAIRRKARRTINVY